MQSMTFKSTPQPLLELTKMLCMALFGLSFLITLGLGLWWLDVPGMDLVVEEAEEMMSLLPLLVVLTVTSGLALLFVSLQASPSRNFLLLDDVGLTQVQLGQRRRWLWRDLTTAEVKDRPFGMKVGQLEISGDFGWPTRLGMLLTNGVQAPGRLIALLPDFYEAPIEDVIAKIRDYRNRALGRGQRGIAAPPLPAIHPPGQPVAFRKSPAKYRGEAVLHYIQLMLGSLMLVLTGVVFLLSIDELRDNPWTLDALSDLLLGLGGLAIIVASALTLRAAKPDRNVLRLDPSGLVYLRQGKTYSWAWRDLSAFELHDFARPKLLRRLRAITFTAPGKDRSWRWLRRIYGLPKRPPAVVIEDVYDVPLTEITSTLNAHREQALGSGAGTAGPQAVR